MDKETCVCGHQKKSHRNRPFGSAVKYLRCHVKGCDCSSFKTPKPSPLTDSKDGVQNG